MKKWIDIIPLKVACTLIGWQPINLQLLIRAERPSWARKNNRGWYEIDRPAFIEWKEVRFG